MGEIRLSIGQVNISNYLIVNVREVGNPSVIVQSHVEPPPVPPNFNLLFSGLANVVHYVDFRSSADGISQGLLLGTYVYDVKNEILVSERRWYRVNGFGPYDPPDTATGIDDPYLDGKIVAGVFKEGHRFLVDNIEWEQTGSQINFLVPIPLGDGEYLSVDIAYKTAANPAGDGAFPSDIIEITADTGMVDIHRNKLMEINGSGTLLTVTMPPFSTIPEGTKYAFSTELGTQRNLVIIIDPAAVNYAVVNGVQRTTLYMGRSEYLVLIKKGNNMRVLDWRGDYARVGELAYKDIPPVNSVTHFGAWEDIPDYPRLYEWYVNELDPSYLGAGTYPTIPTGGNRHKWCVDLVNNKIWFPDFGGLFMRCVDPDGNIDTERPVGDRKPGTFQSFALQSHAHFTFVDNGDTFTGTALNEFNYPVRRQGSGGGVGNNNYEYNICASATEPDIGRSAGTGDSETRPQNLNMNVYRII